MAPPYMIVAGVSTGIGLEQIEVVELVKKAKKVAI
jgi:hypothetical protein